MSEKQKDISSLIETTRKQLFELQDISYRDFHCKLIPEINKGTIIGVRTPVLRKYAKAFVKEHNENEIEEFLTSLPHTYYEENNLHGFIIEGMKDYDECVRLLDIFLPYVDNWATCDLMSPKIFRRNTDKLINKIYKWLESDDTYVVRFAIKMLMNLYLDEEFKPEYLDTVTGIRSKEYYINMMKAWYMATALAKQYDITVTYIEQHKLDIWSHNKSIQKAIESNRISAEQKNYLRALKMKP
jgi:3-methyladenine DNA glycosylase AlkD